MEIPLVLRAKAGGKIIYAVSGLFRAAMAAILAVLAAALLMDGGSPGVGGYVALGLTALAGLYEERWTFDPSAGTIVHRAGLLFLARRTAIALGDVARFRVEAFVRGTLPGSADEAARNAAALEGGRPDDGSIKRSSHKRPYLCIVCETVDGSRYFIDALPARKAEALKRKASAIAEACGKELIEAYSGS